MTDKFDALDWIQRVAPPESESPEETLREKVVIVDGIQDGTIGGSSSREKVHGDGRVERIKETVLVRTCIGCLVSSDPEDSRYPYYAGNCDWGHPTCSDHLKICDQPGCGKLLCPREYVEYQPEKFKCRKHNRIRLAKQFLKFLLLPFLKFPNEEPSNAEK